jgi:deoxycytidylate deaminase
MDLRTNADRYTINSSTVFLRRKPLTLRWVRGFKIAAEASKESSGGLMRLGAAIFHGNRLLSTGYNLYGKTKPGNIGLRLDGTSFDITTHAEQLAADRIKYKQENNKNLILYVVRVSSKGKYVCSMPCNLCIEYLRKYGIKRIRFINKEGIPEEMMLK